MKSLLLFVSVVGVCGLLLAQSTGLEKRDKLTDSNDGKKQIAITEFYMNGMLVRKEFVEKRKSDGTRLAGYTKLYQGGKLVCLEIWGPGNERQRTYYRDGQQIMTEMDKNGDGNPDWRIVYRDDGKAYAVFKCSGLETIELLGTNALADFDAGLDKSSGVIEVITNIVRQQSGGKK